VEIRASFKILNFLLFMIQKILTIALFLTGTISMNGQMNKIEFTEYNLDNGLHVILHEDHSTPIVAVSVLYHVGSKNEKPDRTGFAHFFEHLLFEGSENIARGEFDEYIQNAGGTLNANTSWDRTYYYEVLPSNQLELGLWLESERMLHAKVNEKGVETQREVVKEERRQRVENQPYGSLMEQVFKRAYKEHPYRWPIIGSMEHLDAAVEEDYVQFYRDFYVPNNATLSIAGDFKTEEAKRWIKQYFNTIPKKADPYRPNITESPLGGEIRDTIYDNIQLPMVVQAYRIPAQGTKDFYAVSMLAQMLSQGESSRFHKKLVDEEEKALFASNFPISMEDPGLSLAYAIANMGVDPREVETLMDIEIMRAQTELIPDEEFQKLRNQVENDFVSVNSSMIGIAESLANYHTYFGNADLINTEINRYLEVTTEDIRRVAKEYFTPNNRIVLYYMPKATP
jgi:zinc protease